MYRLVIYENLIEKVKILTTRRNIEEGRCLINLSLSIHHGCPTVEEILKSNIESFLGKKSEIIGLRTSVNIYGNEVRLIPMETNLPFPEDIEDILKYLNDANYITLNREVDLRNADISGDNKYPIIQIEYGDSKCRLLPDDRLDLDKDFYNPTILMVLCQVAENIIRRRKEK